MHAVETAGRPGRPPGVSAGPDGLTTRQASIVSFTDHVEGVCITRWSGV